MEQDRRERASGIALGRWLPLGVLLLGLALFFLLGLDRYLSYDALREHRETLLRFVAAERVEAVLGFTLIYALATAFSLPAGALRAPNSHRDLPVRRSGSRSVTSSWSWMAVQ